MGAPNRKLNSGPPRRALANTTLGIFRKTVDFKSLLKKSNAYKKSRTESKQKELVYTLIAVGAVVGAVAWYRNR